MNTSMRCFALTFAVVVGLGSGLPGIGRTQNAVTQWVGIIEPSIHNPSAPRTVPSAEILHTIIHLAVHDAVVAIEGGYEPYAAPIAAPAGADVRAAVATAAYRAALGRVASSQFAYLDGQYATYMAAIPDGQAKTDGIAVGEAAAAAILALRADDGFNDVVLYSCSSTPPPYAEFEPNGGCGTQPVSAEVGQITPFTYSDPDRYLPDGPPPFRSRLWVSDYNEVKDYGRADSSVRTAEQTDIAYFWSENAYVHWNRNLNSLAIARGLDVLGTARLFALVHTAVSDAVIAGFHTKYSYRFLRPRTAIPRAAEDGNANTEPDATWTPLLTVNHPEYPSAHAFWSTALTGAIAGFFCEQKLTWTITTSQAAVPQLVQTQRTYTRLDDITAQIREARIWAGLHWRESTIDGRELGEDVVEDVLEYFAAGEDCPKAAPPDLLVSSELTRQVKRYDGRTGAFLGNFVNAPQNLPRLVPFGLTFGPDENLYMGGTTTAATVGGVNRFNGSTGAFINSFTFGFTSAIIDMIFGPDGDLYGSIYGANAVFHLDGASGAFIRNIGAGSPLIGPTGLAFGRDGNLYVSSFNTGQILRFDGTTGAYLGVFATTPIGYNLGDVDFGPDGNLYAGICPASVASCFFSSHEGDIWRFDGTTGASLYSFIPAGDRHPNPFFFEFGPDGNLYVTEYASDHVLRYNGATGAFIDVFASGGGLDGPTGLAFVPELGSADDDGDGVSDAEDTCRFYASENVGDTDADGRGDACECTDQNGDGRNTVSDLIAINTATFTPALATPLCDGNNDGRCNMMDIVAGNIEIFSPTNTSTCARQPYPWR